MKDLSKEIKIDFQKNGKIDIDAIKPTSRLKTVLMKEIILELENKNGKMVSVEKLIDASVKRGIKYHEIAGLVEKLFMAGEVYVPKKGFVKTI